MALYTLRTLILLFVVYVATLGLTPNVSAAIQGQLVLSSSSAGWESGGIWRPSVAYNGTSFMMWYTGSDPQGTWEIGLATSNDGIAWTRYQNNPVLRIGSESNGDWDYGAVGYSWVLYVKGQYKMWYVGQIYSPVGDITSQMVGYATSPDGINWTKYSGNPVLTPDPSEPWYEKYLGLPAVVWTGSSFLMYYVAANDTASQGIVAASPDGIHWTRKAVVHIPIAAWDSYTDYRFISSVTDLSGTFMMSYYGRSQSTSPSEIGVALSTDGLTWGRYGGNPVITYGSAAWDARTLAYPTLIPFGDNYYVYYTGYPATGPSQIGLARLPGSQFPIPEYPSANTLLIAVTVLVSGLLWMSKRQQSSKS